MSGREGGVQAATSSSKSNMGSIQKAVNLPLEVISHREHRRKLFAKRRQTEGGIYEWKEPKPRRVTAAEAAVMIRRRQRQRRERGGDLQEQDGDLLLHDLSACDPPLTKAMIASGRALSCFLDETEEVHPMLANVLRSVICGITLEIQDDRSRGIKCPMRTKSDQEALTALRMTEAEEEGPMRTMEEQGKADQVDDADQEVLTVSRMTYAEQEGHTRTKEEQGKADQEVIILDDAAWLTVSQYRHEWDGLWSADYGSFEDNTRIPSMRFTDNHVTHHSLLPMATLQIFSVKLAATGGSLHLPLDVFGMVAVRDPIDHNRNIIFQRTRDDCQTLTKEDPYLVLTGPTRAVMLIESCPVIIEIDLKVKGSDDSADECLSFRVAPVLCFDMMYSHLLNYAFTSKLSTLEFKLGHIVSSVEATIVLQVTRGSWPDGLHGVFAAFTTGIYDKYTDGVFLDKRIIRIGHERIMLLDSRGEKLPVIGDGQIKLSRSVVSVETSGKLIVRVKALGGDGVVEKESSFDPLEAGSSIGELEFSFCTLEVTVFWSLLSESADL
ncbi:unnamed protein product [Urochloa humidicola]